MECKNCGAIVPDGVLVCKKCGANVNTGILPTAHVFDPIIREHKNRCSIKIVVIITVAVVIIIVLSVLLWRKCSRKNLGVSVHGSAQNTSVEYAAICQPVKSTI